MSYRHNWPRPARDRRAESVSVKLGSTSRLVRGDLHLHGWVYKIETGEVFAYDFSQGQFVPVASYQPSEATVRRRTVVTI